MKVYWKKAGSIGYLFYIETGQLERPVIVIEVYTRGKRVSVNKRGRLKTLLLNIPILDTITRFKFNEYYRISLSEEMKRLWIELNEDETKELYIKYNLEL